MGGLYGVEMTHFVLRTVFLESFWNRNGEVNCALGDGGRRLYWRTYVSLTDLATHINQDISFTARLLRLTQLSPRVIESIFAGEEPDGLSLNTLTKLLPVIWEEQEAELGFPM